MQPRDAGALDGLRRHRMWPMQIWEAECVQGHCCCPSSALPGPWCCQQTNLENAGSGEDAPRQCDLALFVKFLFVCPWSWASWDLAGVAQGTVKVSRGTSGGSLSEEHFGFVHCGQKRDLIPNLHSFKCVLSMENEASRRRASLRRECQPGRGSLSWQIQPLWV